MAGATPGSERQALRLEIEERASLGNSRRSPLGHLARVAGSPIRSRWRIRLSTVTATGVRSRGARPFGGLR